MSIVVECASGASVPAPIADRLPLELAILRGRCEGHRQFSNDNAALVRRLELRHWTIIRILHPRVLDAFPVSASECTRSSKKISLFAFGKASVQVTEALLLIIKMLSELSPGLTPNNYLCI
jgi:hypothetical protein